MVHLLDAGGEEAVHRGVARAAPDLPDRVLRQRPHEVVLVAQRLEEGGQVGRGAELAHPGCGEAARFDVSAVEIAERLFPRGARPVLGARRGGHEERESESQGAGYHAERPMSERNCASSSTVRPSREASSALEPGSSPTTT